MNEKQAIQSLAALAQEARLRVFRALVVAGQVGMTPTAISGSLGLAGNTLSFHLKELAHAGLITQERQGRNLIYRAEFANMNGLLTFLTENCCRGQECLSPATPSCGC